MSKIPEEFIQRLKDTTDLVSFANQYTNLKKVSNNVWQGICPHPHHMEKSPSFTIWEKENSWCCYGCHTGKKDSLGNVGSDIFSFVQWVTNKNFKEAVAIVAAWNNVSIPEDESQKIYDYNYKQAMKYKKDLKHNEDVLDYLYKRGLDDDDIELYHLGYSKFDNRVTFPLLDNYNNIIGFTKRSLNPNCSEDSKYINSKASKVFNKSIYLYGIKDIDKNFNEIRITEGTFDVILASKYNAKNVVAALGTSFTEKHAEMIKKTGKTPVLILDRDKAGEKAMYKIISYFDNLDVYCKVVMLPEGKDLADVSLDKKFSVEKYISENAVTSGYKKIQDIITSYNSSLYELRLSFSPKIEDIMKNVPLMEQKRIKSFVKDEINMTIE